MQPWIHVRDVMELRRAFAEEEALWVVDVGRQLLYGWTRCEALTPRPISTAAAGLGNQPDSLQTPLGAHRVRAVIGVGAALGQPFVSREAVGNPLPHWTGGSGDAILSRVLTLEGLVPGLNHNSLSRFIYLHGTDQEENLGKPVSHGCIRMANRDIAALADALGAIHPLVWIGSVEQARYGAVMMS